MKKSNGRDSLKRFRKWLDEGSDPLDMEMEDALSEPEEICSRDAEEPAWAASDAQFEHNTLGNRLTGMSRRAYYVYYSFLAVLVCAGLISVLLYATLHMPKFGGADTLVDSDLTAFYVENTLKDTGAQNVVTGIILNYRGFDTLGESHVLFSAVCTVLLMLRLTGNDERELLVWHLCHSERASLPRRRFLRRRHHRSRADSLPERLRISQNRTLHERSGVQGRLRIGADVLYAVQGVPLHYGLQRHSQRNRHRHAGKHSLRRAAAAAEHRGGLRGRHDHVRHVHHVPEGGFLTCWLLCTSTLKRSPP